MVGPRAVRVPVVMVSRGGSRPRPRPRHRRRLLSVRGSKDLDAVTTRSVTGLEVEFVLVAIALTNQ